MKLRKLGDVEEEKYFEDPGDVMRIQSLIISKGYECSFNQAGEIWQEHSRGMAAGWLLLPEDDEILWQDLRGCIDEEYS